MSNEVTPDLMPSDKEPIAYRVWNRMGGISYRLTKPADNEYVEWDVLYDYPDGIIVGPCLCGSWPGGKCLKCPRVT